MKFVKESKKISSKKKILDDPYEVLQNHIIEKLTEYDQYSDEQSVSSDEVNKIMDEDGRTDGDTEFNYAVDVMSNHPDV